MENMNGYTERQNATSAVRRIEALPRTDIVERHDGITLYFDVPGVASEGPEIHVEKNVLTVSAEVTLDDLPGYRLEGREFRPKSYRRSFTLPDGIDADRIAATLKDGVLRLDLPKSERLKARKIQVKAG